jgi:peptidoglycan-N-acetylglucosamine deacetylase
VARFTDGGGRTGRAAELDRAERMYQAVLGEQRGSRPAGSAGLSRRVVFAAAGATFLSAASACGAVTTVNTAHHGGGAGPLATTPDRSGGAGPTATAAAGTRGPGGSQGATGSGSPSTSGSSPDGTGAPTDPFTGDTGTPTPAPPPAGPNVANAGPQVNGSQVQTKPQYYVDAGPKVIALTLDDGPSRYTSQILEILAQYKVIATFCMIGRQVAGSASVVREVAAAGHHITNHTWDHADQSKLSLSAVTSELDRTNQALADVGITATMYRAPYGSWSPTVFEAAAAAGLRPLDWSVDPRDWSNPGVQSIVSNILRHTDTGKIILDHDGGGNRAQTVAAMRIWLPRLLDDGYRFTTP